MTAAPLTVSSLHIYPVKSCAGIALDKAEVLPRGLQHDRRWMVVDASGRFITQRDYPRMALIAVELTATGLRLHAPEAGSVDVVVPLGSRVPVSVWKSDLTLPVADDGVNAWLSAFLGQPCRLVHLPDSMTRAVTSARRRDGDEVSLADGFPILVATMASLTNLNARLEKPLPMNRFRPNIVIEGAGAWEEDTWHEVQIGGVRLELMKPCTRCNLTQVEQASGAEDGKEPIRTLRKFRFSQAEAGVLFGVNATPRSPGTIKQGDVLEILSRQPAPELLLRA